MLIAGDEMFRSFCSHFGLLIVSSTSISPKSGYLDLVAPIGTIDLANGKIEWSQTVYLETWSLLSQVSCSGFWGIYAIQYLLILVYNLIFGF